MYPESDARPKRENMPQQKQQSKSKKFTRRRSLRACTSCNKRKVRCDVMKKNYPYEKCTNCFEFGVDCILTERRAGRMGSIPFISTNPNPRDTKVKTVSGSRNYSSSIPTITGSSFLPIVTPNLDTASSSTMSGTNELQIELDKAILVKFDKSNFKEIFKNSTASFFIKYAIDRFMTCEDGFADSDSSGNKNVIQYLTSSNGNAFTLPSKETCDAFINAFFTQFNPGFNVINKKSFLRDYSDLKNPSSLLLLRCVLYIGSLLCRPITGQDATLDDSDVMFHRAKLIYDAKLETRPLPLVQSLILLSFHSENKVSLMDRSTLLDNAITIAFTFSFHLDQSNNPDLSDEDKLQYKFLFWVLFSLDKTLSFTFARPYRIDLKACTVKLMSRDDFLKLICQGEEPDLASKLNIDYYLSSLKFYEMMVQVTDQQCIAFKLGLQGNPYSQVTSHIDNMITSWYKSLPETLHEPKVSGMKAYLLTIYYTTLKFCLIHSSICYNGFLIREMSKPQFNYLIYAIKSFNSDKLYSYLVELFCECMEAAPHIVEMHTMLQFSPHLFQMILHMALTCSPYLYLQDDILKNQVKQSLDKTRVLFQKLIIFDFNSPASLIIKLGFFFFEKIYPDKERLIDYLREVMLSDLFELSVSLDVEKLGDAAPFDKAYQKLLVDQVPAVTSEIYRIPESLLGLNEWNIMRDETLKTHSSVISDHFGKFEFDKDNKQYKRFLPPILPLPDASRSYISPFYSYPGSIKENSVAKPPPEDPLADLPFESALKLSWNQLILGPLDSIFVTDDKVPSHSACNPIINAITGSNTYNDTASDFPITNNSEQDPITDIQSSYLSPNIQFPGTTPINTITPPIITASFLANNSSVLPPPPPPPLPPPQPQPTELYPNAYPQKLQSQSQQHANRSSNGLESFADGLRFPTPNVPTPIQSQQSRNCHGIGPGASDSQFPPPAARAPAVSNSRYFAYCKGDAEFNGGDNDRNTCL